MRRILDLLEERERIGTAAFGYRVRQEISRRLGLDVRNRPIQGVTARSYRDACRESIPSDPDDWKVQVRGAKTLAENLAAETQNALLYKELVSVSFDESFAAAL